MAGTVVAAHVGQYRRIQGEDVHRENRSGLAPKHGL
jgi:hypothetical protein